MKKTNRKEALKIWLGVLLLPFAVMAEAIQRGCKNMGSLPKKAITGAELDDISDDDICEAVKKYSVYARVQPEHKVRIVTAWKAKGKITFEYSPESFTGTEPEFALEI